MKTPSSIRHLIPAKTPAAPSLWKRPEFERVPPSYLSPVRVKGFYNHPYPLTAAKLPFHVHGTEMDHGWSPVGASMWIGR